MKLNVEENRHHQAQLFYAQIQKENGMKRNTRCCVAIVGIGLALIMPLNRTIADADTEKREFEESQSFKKLSAEWWQWALSIPTSVNPLLETNDTKAERCMVGQRGPVWFLAGVFGGGTVIRRCSLPEGKELYFPVINSLQFNSPGVCGLPPQSVSELRTLAADLIDKAANLSVTVDAVTIKNLRRVKSKVFEVALPEENVFGAPCPPSKELVPAGIYSPAVDDGFYVLLHPLPVGSHTLHFHAESPKGVVQSDVTYHLMVVPVSLK